MERRRVNANVYFKHPGQCFLTFHFPSHTKLKETCFNISVDLPGVVNIKDYQLILGEFSENEGFFLIVYMGG